MFKLLTVEDVVRIPPEQFGKPLKAVARKQIKLKYENMVDEELGYVVLIVDVRIDPTGKILPGDGSTYHKATFDLLSFYPTLQEVVEGEVIEITDFGAFVRIGPQDALLHISQVTDDFISYDERQGVLAGKETQRTLSKNDLVRARVIAVSFPRGGVGERLGLRCDSPS